MTVRSTSNFDNSRTRTERGGAGMGSMFDHIVFDAPSPVDTAATAEASSTARTSVTASILANDALFADDTQTNQTTNGRRRVDYFQG